MLKEGDRLLAKLAQKKRILELSEIYLRSLPIQCYHFDIVYMDFFDPDLGGTLPYYHITTSRMGRN